MSKAPAVSIVVPTRDRPEYLIQCLDGIASQTSEEYEVLIVDDGSISAVRERYREIVKRFGTRFRLLENNPSGSSGSGPSVIRNIGLSHATGEYIAFCDDDDYWCREDHLETALDSLRKHRGDLYLSGQRAVAPNGSIKLEKLMAKVESIAVSYQPIDERGVYRISTDEALVYPDYAHLNITILSRDLLRLAGSFWEHTTYAEDVHFFVRVCAAAENILYRPEVCAVHNIPAERKVADSVSTLLSDLDKQMLEAMVYEHLVSISEHPAALRYARLSLNNLQKQITRELEAEGRIVSAAVFARNAFATFPGFRWGIKMALLTVRSVFRR